MTLIFATNNQHKVDEIKNILGKNFEIISLKDAGITIDIPEPHNTLEKNATKKSKTIYNIANCNCFSEDTGLEVDALHGEPGVKSARYAGEKANSEQNIEKLLNELEQFENRKARFRTIISLMLNGVEYQFEGICEGSILNKREGSSGFGYDAVFKPNGSEKSFGEMELNQKNGYSHRKKAVNKMVSFLHEITL